MNGSITPYLIELITWQQNHNYLDEGDERNQLFGQHEPIQSNKDGT
jgi:hypothetical protein